MFAPCHLESASCPPQRGRLNTWSKSTRARTPSCMTSSPFFHSSPLSVSCHLFLSCPKPDEGRLTDDQKSSILAARWPVNIWTSQSWQDLALLSAALTALLLLLKSEKRDDKATTLVSFERQSEAVLKAMFVLFYYFCYFSNFLPTSSRRMNDSSHAHLFEWAVSPLRQSFDMCIWLYCRFVGVTVS